MKLAPGTVHLWEVDLDGFQSADFLSEDEKARAGRIKFERDRKRYVAGRNALRIILGRYGEEPKAICFEYGPAGKPFVSGLSFNLAHSESRALVAVTARAMVGVDVERVRALDDLEETARHAFAAGEFARWKQAGGKVEDFYRIWTRKEAYLKAIGEGIAQRLQRFEVSFEPGEEARIVCGGEGEWTLVDVSEGGDYISAIAVEGKIAAIERRSEAL